MENLSIESLIETLLYLQRNRNVSEGLQLAANVLQIHCSNLFILEKDEEAKTIRVLYNQLSVQSNQEMEKYRKFDRDKSQEIWKELEKRIPDLQETP